jgi:hypothetical protein
LDQFKKDQESITPVLREAFAKAGKEQSDGPDPFNMPGEKLTFFDIIAFINDRESYCIGQIGLYRRLLGY